MMQTNLFFETDPKEEKERLTAKRKEVKTLHHRDDPTSSIDAAVSFVASGARLTHNGKILEALTHLREATGHEIEQEIRRRHPDSPLTHVQIMRRTNTCEGVETTKVVRRCVCGGECGILKIKHGGDEDEREEKRL